MGMPPDPSQSRPTRVFISYSHDSREHEDRVLALADHLRQDGVDAIVDQYVPAPPEGWPMWMDRELQNADFILLVCTETYLRRVEGREQPGKGRGVLWEAKVIYTLAYETETAIQRFVPIVFEDFDVSKIPTPLRALTHYQLSAADGYEGLYRHITNQPRHRIPELGKPKALSSMPPQSYAASLEARARPAPSTRLDQRNRRRMLRRVRLDWIEGVLKQSLYQVARLDLRLEPADYAIERPLNTFVQVPDRLPKPLKPGVALSRLFDDLGQAVLILGAPGAGKTTLLLELAQELLDTADQDESAPIPVVFNLSSWAVPGEPLERWLVRELNERSGVPNRLAWEWVESEQIIPLLDGLDEVAVDRRRACVEAINGFRRDHGLLPIAICSRIGDYESLSPKLRLQNAILIQTLTKSQVHEYLQRAGEPMRGLQITLETDALLWELLETPLMLWVAMLAYRGAPGEFPVQQTVEQRRNRLFATFVDAMFKRRSVQVRYSRKQTVRWLSLLASRLAGFNRTVFYLEDLHLGWYPTHRL